MPFERQVLSVFADFDAMLLINPLGKVPVLQLDNGERLFDSRAILDHLDEQAERGPPHGADRADPTAAPSCALKRCRWA